MPFIEKRKKYIHMQRICAVQTHKKLGGGGKRRKGKVPFY